MAQDDEEKIKNRERKNKLEVGKREERNCFVLRFFF